MFTSDDGKITVRVISLVGSGKWTQVRCKTPGGQTELGRVRHTDPNAPDLLRQLLAEWGIGYSTLTERK
jgi:hypothetical protein